MGVVTIRTPTATNSLALSGSRYEAKAALLSLPTASPRMRAALRPNGWAASTSVVAAAEETSSGVPSTGCNGIVGGPSSATEMVPTLARPPAPSRNPVIVRGVPPRTGPAVGRSRWMYGDS